jgi:pSer/pThr/pTyr-binding forkhead associated (FHA) protein
MNGCVSHTHALLVANPDGCWSLVDMESANGTYTFIDGQYKRIEANQSVPLEDGDQIFLGAWTTLTLRMVMARQLRKGWRKLIT